MAWICIVVFAMELSQRLTAVDFEVDYNGHEHGLRKAHQLTVGPEFDEFPEYYHMPKRYASLPWFGSYFQMITPRSHWVLYSTRDDGQDFDGLLGAHKNMSDDSKTSWFRIEPGFHRNSVMIKDFKGRKLGVGHSGSGTIDDMGVTFKDVVEDNAACSWFVYKHKMGSHHGLILESLRHEYVLGLHDDGEPFVIQKLLINDMLHFEGITFRNINTSQWDEHHYLLKEAKRKWHDNIHKPEL